MEQYMRIALEEAKKAYAIDEVPVGAVIVYQDEVIAKAHNLRETNQSSLSHAENLVIDIANKKLKTWQLNECTLYVTLEPCVMCAGSIMSSRIKKVVFGAYDEKGGAFGSIANLNDIKALNHHVEIQGGVLEKECANLMTEFFKEKRKQQIKIREVNDTSQFEQLKKLRYEVFVNEQKVDPNLEYDEYDILNRNDVVHVVALKEDSVVGGLRLLKKDNIIKVGRVVVDKTYRKHKIGSKLMAYAERYAFNNGFDELQLGAQVTAIPFYESCGYKAYGTVFLDAGIDHIMMKKTR